MGITNYAWILCVYMCEKEMERQVCISDGLKAKYPLDVYHLRILHLSFRKIMS